MLTSFAGPYFGRWSTSFFFFHHFWHANLRSGEEFYQLPPCPLRVETQVGLLLLFALSKHILLREIAQSLPASTPSRGWKQHVFLTKSFNRKCLFFFFFKVNSHHISSFHAHAGSQRRCARWCACHQFLPSHWHAVFSIPDVILESP